MVTEVFNRIGEIELYSKNTNFYKRKREEDNDFEPHQKIESTSKPLTDVKKEFFEHLEDDSLTVDTCSNLTNDWNKK